MSATATEQPTAVLEPWFFDGNIVVQAGNRRFKVYKGILAAHSVVFRDMLALASAAPEIQAIDSDDLVDGCPLVALQDDEEDLANFLKAIFLPGFLPQYPNEASLQVILSCLRLSHKYQVDYLQLEALKHLSSGYPTTLAELDSRRIESGTVVGGPTWSWIKNLTGLVIRDHVEIINCAFTVDARWILPFALLDLSDRIALETAINMTDGLVPGFDAMRDLPESLYAALLGFVASGRHASAARIYSSLAAGIPDCYVRAREDNLHDWAEENSAGSDPAGCAHDQLAMVRGLIESLSGIVHPLRVAQLHGHSSGAALDGMCSACRTELTARYRARRREEWAKYLAVFGLGTWEELEALKKRAFTS
ncbi:BTB domain-containing protein [Mycena kentingensis (nom. inval.)]|nr:BTB domain-containing protein [Mycena kentingensis (nom. inval.)]